VGTYQGMWAGISGYVEVDADSQALKEIEEETHLTKEEVELVRKGDPIEVVDGEKGIKWIVHPYLFRVKHPDLIETDWEHTEMKWIEPEDIDEYQTVPRLADTLRKLSSGLKR